MIAPPIPVYILAGGRSSRFGSDKARALVDGVPLVTRVARALQPLAGSITIVSDGVRNYGDLGLRTLGDTQPGLGPMGGLATAFDDLDRDEEWLVLASCDLIAPDPSWVADLMSTAEPPATAFAGDNWEPLLALYHRSILPNVLRRIETGELSMQRLLDGCGCRAVPLPAGLTGIPQANRPADLGLGNMGSELAGTRGHEVE